MGNTQIADRFGERVKRVGIMTRNWTEFYSTGEDICPIDEDALIWVMMLDGEIWFERAGDMDWGVIDDTGEIVAYRYPYQTTIELYNLALARLGRFM